MAEDDKVLIMDEESDTDRINKFVTGSEDGEIVDKDEEKFESNSKEDNDAKEPEERKKETPKKHTAPTPVTKTVKAHAHKKAEPKREEKKEEHKKEKKAVIISKKLFSKKKAEKLKEDPKPKKVSRLEKDSKSRDKKNNKTKNILLWTGIAILAIILIVALVMLFWPDREQTGTGNETTNTVAATVNGEAIYLQDVTRQYASLNPLLQEMYTIESLLNKSIDDMLLYQEAKNIGIKIAKEDIQAEIDDILLQNGMTQEQLEEALKNQGMTLEDAKTLIEKNLAIREMLNTTVLQKVEITNEDIEAYYELNKEDFALPQQVTIRHILVLVSEDVDNETAKAKIEQINDELKEDNFCELAAKYSEDPGSKDDCGEYTFGKGDFNNPEFENPSFDLEVGETSIIQTVFGYHLLKKVANIPAHTQEISEVYDLINSTLYDEDAQNKFDALLIKLREEATIINYYTKEDVDSKSEPVLEPINNLDDFAKCLTENNVTLYGAYWCPHCENQREMFGDSVEYINYVECAVEGQPQVQTKACTAAEISGYPTWIINGKQYPGEQTLSRLEALTGCKR